jgi:hypothetical protein
MILPSFNSLKPDTEKGRINGIRRTKEVLKDAKPIFVA